MTRATTLRDARETNAVETLERAGLTVEAIAGDDMRSLVGGRFEWHRTTNHWRDRESGREGYGLSKLIAAAKEGAA